MAWKVAQYLHSAQTFTASTAARVCAMLQYTLFTTDTTSKQTENILFTFFVDVSPKNFGLEFLDPCENSILFATWLRQSI